VGLPAASLTKLLVDSPFASANAMREILTGRDQGPRRHHALLNGAAALLVAGLAADLASGLKLAARAVDDGRASRTLDQLVRLSNAGAD
jgi:anthranilate phosphoribosyltransferase